MHIMIRSDSGMVMLSNLESLLISASLIQQFLSPKKTKHFNKTTEYNIVLLMLIKKNYMQEEANHWQLKCIEYMPYD